MAFKNLENRIKNAKLTNTEQIIAEYFLHNFTTIGFMTITEIAQKLGLSEASIFRMARSLGYQGFNELKNEIKATVSSQLMNHTEYEYSKLAPIERFKANVELLTSNDTSNQLATNTISAINEVLNKNDHKNFETCLEILNGSRNKYICGFRSTAFVAEFFAFESLFLLPHIIVNTHADGKAIERMVDLTSEDCVVLFVYPRYSKINYIIKEMALSAGAKTILIIDKLSSELAKDVDVVLTCNPRSLSYYNSIIPMSFICEILITELSKKLPENFEKRSDYICRHMDPAELF